MKKLLLSVVMSVGLFANNCETRLFTLQTAPGVSVAEIVSNLSEECGLTVILGDKLTKRKYRFTRLGRLNLKNVSFYKLLDLTLKNSNLDYSIENNILKISYLQTKTFHLDYINSKRIGKAVIDASVDTGVQSTDGQTQGSGSNGDINTISAEDSFDFWETVQKELYAIVNRPGDEYKAPMPIVNKQAGLVTITATPKQMERVENYIKKIERRLHQEVMIDVSILAVFLNDNITTGIDWSKFNLSVNGNAGLERVGVGDNFGNIQVTSSASTLINTALNMTGILDFLKKEGKVVTLSNPKILTLNNQPAIISIGDTYNFNIPTSITISANSNGLGEKSYTPSSIFVGILLNITPEITENGDVILRINPSISELRNPDELSNIGPEGFRQIAPDTKEKKISSVVKVKNGSTLILGGLISNTKNFRINGVPVLKDVPIFGNLFKSNTKDNQRFELVFILRTKILHDAEENLGLKDLGFEKLTYEKK
ncbi:pilus (MSHA type) biogenesis protein MshL [Nitratiruptor sp. YY09-18]|uniref:pilus (MSHA type) biogenesis protein MshL n=1 Tax=Nitratiruptor sp. YY09-18 TaxID=2724901 RepID=UPI0019168419|nr:pilus (MSHA type) biogenesis protein MshL [Nitratiruptor sp. YY09-18]BCD68072.1 general secretion pathway protein D [Nitratiruptor sp. YY09-18]